MKYRQIIVDGQRILEHRHIMQKHLGRELDRDECVHHINGNGLDNRLENLEVKSRAQHTKDHQINGDIHRIKKEHGDAGRRTQKKLYAKRIAVCDRDFNPLIVIPSMTFAESVGL